MKKEFIFLVLLIFLVSHISASIMVGDLSHSIENEYGPNENIRGWINISLDEEATDSVLESFFNDIQGEGVSLIELIKSATDAGFEFDYTCTTSDCMSDYSGEDGETSKIFNLEEGESALFGFVLSGGNLDGVSNFYLDLTSNNPESEEIPLTIDILNDEEIEWQAYEGSGNFGDENLGCFVNVDTTLENIPKQNPYCETVSLEPAPGVEIGAYLIYSQGDKNVDFNLEIRNTYSGKLGTCIATAGGTGRISCIPSSGFVIEQEGDFSVCINVKDESKIYNYKIARESNDPCGFTGEYEYDFNIFARPEKYNSNIAITLNDDELDVNAEIYIRNYVEDKYDDDCSEGCIIPIKISAGIGQDVTISNAMLDYTAGGSPSSTNEIYALSETAAKISTLTDGEPEFQRLYLQNAGFATPSEYGEYEFSLKSDEEKLISEDISVEKVPEIQSLTPLDTAVKYPTKFKVTLTSNKNVTKYEWDFGEGKNSQITTIPETSYTYNAEGEYNITITATDNLGRSSSKKFSVNVGPASLIVPQILDRLKTDLQTIKNQMTNFSQFETDMLKTLLKIDEVETSLTEIDGEMLNAESETDYEIILGKLLEIDIPKSVVKTISSSGIIFYPETDNIDLNILKNIGGGDYESDKKDAYKNAVLAWNEENTETSLSYEEISLVYEDYDEPFLKVFDFSVTNKGQNNVYMIIKDMEDFSFKQDYSEEKEENYYYVNLDKGENNIIFSTTEDVDFISVPAFISPGLSELSLAEWTSTGDEELREWVLKWIFFSVIVIVILLIAAIIWVILQLWYKRKYENYLFKNQNNLYNLVNFIEAEKGKGKTDRDIISRLKKTGWKSEQIKYAMRKYSGKRTGMLEIPLEKIFRKKSAKNNK